MNKWKFIFCTDAKARLCDTIHYGRRLEHVEITLQLNEIETFVQQSVNDDTAQQIRHQWDKIRIKKSRIILLLNEFETFVE